MKENKYLVESSYNFLKYSLDEIAELSKDDQSIKNELYFRLERLIKIKTFNFLKNKYGDEADILYNIYMASERSLKSYNKEVGPFLKYWNTSIEKSLLNLKIKNYYREKEKIDNEINYDEKFDYEEIDVCSNDIKYLSVGFYNNIQVKLDYYENILLLLYIAGYKYSEIEQCIKFNNKKIISSMKNIFVKLKKGLIA